MYFTVVYCKFGNFRENFTFANSVKTHICAVKNSRQGRDLPISVNERVISPIHEGFIFTKLRICEVSRNYNPRENFRIYSTFKVKFPHFLVTEYDALYKQEELYDPALYMHHSMSGQCYDHIWVAAMALDCTDAHLKATGKFYRIY